MTNGIGYIDYLYELMNYYSFRSQVRYFEIIEKFLDFFDCLLDVEGNTYRYRKYLRYCFEKTYGVFPQIYNAL